jgi:hypothetical protein
MAGLNSFIALRLLVGLFVFSAMCLSPLMAQPVKGSVYKDFLPMGSGTSVALPEGEWANTDMSFLEMANEAWNVYILANKKVNATVPFLIVRQTTAAGRWGNTGCQSNHPHQFMVNEHGTLTTWAKMTPARMAFLPVF